MSIESVSDQPTNEPRLGRSVSIDQAAHLLNVSRRTIYNRIRDGRLQTIRTLGGSQRVLVASLHQHDAPVADLAAENLLAKVGMPGGIMDFAFHEDTVQRMAESARESLERRRPVTAIGTTGQQVAAGEFDDESRDPA